MLAIIIFSVTFLPIFGESNNLTVNGGEQVVIPLIELDIDQQVSGSISVTGGGNEIKFWVLDPDGNTVIHLGVVVQNESFEFTASKNGLYYARLDNRESTAAKNVKMQYDVQVEEVANSLDLWIKSLLILIIASVIFYFIYLFKKRKMM